MAHVWRRFVSQMRVRRRSLNIRATALSATPPTTTVAWQRALSARWLQQRRRMRLVTALRCQTVMMKVRHVDVGEKSCLVSCGRYRIFHARDPAFGSLLST